MCGHAARDCPIEPTNPEIAGSILAVAGPGGDPVTGRADRGGRKFVIHDHSRTGGFRPVALQATDAQDGEIAGAERRVRRERVGNSYKAATTGVS